MTSLSGNCHPACLLLPEMGETEYRELVADIQVHGQRNPITVDGNGDILDGRHRHRAVVELGIEPKVETFTGTEAEKIGFIMSENIHRRHLTVQQRAAVAADLAEKLAEAAKERQLAGKAIPPSGTETLAPTGAKGKATEQAAAMVGGVSPRSVERAIARKKEDPAAHAAAKAGKLPKARPAPKPQPERRVNRQGYVMPGRAGPDLLEALRTADLALPSGFDGAVWYRNLLAIQQDSISRTVFNLSLKLDLLKNAIALHHGWTVSRPAPMPEQAAALIEDAEPAAEPERTRSDLVRQRVSDLIGPATGRQLPGGGRRKGKVYRVDVARAADMPDGTLKTLLDGGEIEDDQLDRIETALPDLIAKQRPSRRRGRVSRAAPSAVRRSARIR